MLSAISVIRSDMFGARVPEAARAAAPPPAVKAGRSAPTPPRPAHPPARGRGRQRRRPRRARRRPAPDRSRHRRRDPARRRLRLHPARPRSRASGDQWFVEDLGSTNGTYVGSSRITQPTTHRARHPGPHRQDDPGAAEVAHGRAPTPVLRHLRRRPGPQGQPGLRRTPAPGCSPSATASAAPPAATSPPAPRSSSCAASTEQPRDDDLLAPGRRRAAPRPRPDRRAGRGGPRPHRHLHHRDGRALRRHPARHRPPRRHPRLPLPRRRARPAHPRPHLRAVADRRGSDHRGGGAHPPAPQPHPQGPRRHPRGRARPVLRPTVEPGDRILLCSDGACGVLTDGRMADILSTGTPDFAAVELVRASLEAGSTDNVTCLVADVVRRDAAGGPAQPLLVGAAAELPRKPDAGRPRRRRPLPRPPLRRHRRDRAGPRRPPRRGAASRSPPTRSTPRPRATPPARRRYVWLRRLLAAAVARSGWLAIGSRAG